MNEIVFLQPNRLDAVPFTTSKVIAEFAEVQHHTITRLIREHKTDFQEFGKIGFEIEPLPDSKTGQSLKVYRLNEEQATLLMTYLRNTPTVKEFKKNLVRQFYAMRTELQKRAIEREALKPVRRSMTDAIQAAGGDQWSYKHYTDLAYKSTVGKNAAQLRKERGADKKAKAVEYMTADEIKRVTRRQEQFAVLVEMGLDYQQIKAIALKQAIPAAAQ